MLISRFGMSFTKSKGNRIKRVKNIKNEQSDVINKDLFVNLFFLENIESKKPRLD